MVGLVEMVVAALLPLASWIGAAEQAAPSKALDELAAGKFLVSAASLSDPNFERTVVLLVHFDERGAMGLIVNRPTERRVGDALHEGGGPEGTDGWVYEGGPVARDAVAILVRSKKKLAGADPVLADLHYSRSRELSRSLLTEPGGRRVRFYAGHSGWAPGQLQAEVVRGDWHVIDADTASVFHDRPRGLWRALVPRDPSRSARLIPPG